MSATAWMVLLPLTLVLVIAAAARFGPFGRRFRRAQAVRLVCPTRCEDVDCRIEQEVYTGQWQAVTSCSAHPGQGDPPCDKDCMKATNLGFSLSPRA
jgi:hypothetical protein